MTEVKSANRFQDVFGQPSEGARTKIQDVLSDRVQAFIGQSPFAVLATSSPDGRCDASPRGGRPGFVKVVDEKHLLLPDVAGNRLFQSYGNVDENPHVGLLFMIPGLDNTVRVNGKARVVTEAELSDQNVELSVQFTDDNTRLLQGLLIEVEEAYGHCPRAFKFADLWDTKAIAENRQKEAK